MVGWLVKLVLCRVVSESTGGTEIPRDGGRGRLYSYRYTVTTTENDSCNEMVSGDESHFNVSLIARDQVTIMTVSTDRSF